MRKSRTSSNEHAQSRRGTLPSLIHLKLAACIMYTASYIVIVIFNNDAL